ncbi:MULTISPECIES: FRG domain-containing protein [Halomonas]|uniref:FRG domain-containing protein n=1 Tax=Halomonas halophila TaxID=29573 RepID=A0ABQ0TZZ1_9GAMM|nr:hypothetical protein HHA04nite_01560 [Halomonas halophila]
MYEQKDFQSAYELLDYLSPLHTNRWSRGGRYVFRGQPCSTYGLVPSSLRESGRMAASSVLEPRNASGETRQVFYEVQLLRAFLNGCDASGIKVPGGDRQVRNEVNGPMWEIENLTTGQTWPPYDFYPLLAAAQHHGVPTCLLDWSRRSYVAAYFAASSALADCPGSDQLAIWVLDTNQWWTWDGVGYIELPGATSVNLAAQDGVFTVSTREAHTRGELEATALEELVGMRGDSVDDPTVFWKLTLPQHQAPKLLALCAELGVKGSTMFPGYEGVAREIRDNAYAGSLKQSLWLQRSC